jgi:hypothetical protein
MRWHRGFRVQFLQEKAPLRTGLRIKGINVNKQPCASLVRLFYGFARREPRPSE